MNSPFDQLVETAVGSAQEVLDLHGIEPLVVVDEAAPKSSRWIMASIGFGGARAHGGITLVAAVPFWRAYSGLAGVTDTLPEALLADMAGELANMVVGRMRNALLRGGVTVYQSTPTCAFGEEIAFRDPGDACVRWQHLYTPVGEVFLRLDARLDEDFALHSVSKSPVEATTDTLFF